MAGANSFDLDGIGRIVLWGVVVKYSEFIAAKTSPNDMMGFRPVWMPDFLFPFQSMLVDWSVRRGKAGLFEDCGLGKTPQQLVWCQNMVRKLNKPVLILTPLAVAAQTVREGEKFGIEVYHSRDGKTKKGINVTNYERLGKFDPNKFIAVVCDESGILKNFDGKLRRSITDFMHCVQYRLLCTATPAPNDYMELGTSSEALGEMTRSQMLGMFFRNDGESTQSWTIKGHAQKRFWQWVGRWARAIRKPSDLGFDDGGFVLPDLHIHRHVIPTRSSKGFGFLKANTLEEQRAERKRTLQVRCDKVAEILPVDRSVLIWCHLNDEGDLLEEMIEGAVQVKGSDHPDVKEERLNAFSLGEIRALITKPKIGGFGMNWQICSDMSFFPSHSYEQFYQGVRRCYRFGQKREVNCHVVTTAVESPVLTNMLRKERAAVQMFDGIIREMNAAVKSTERFEYQDKVEIPSWL